MTDGAGYRICVDETALDMLLFAAKVRQAEVAASTGEVAEAAKLARAALELWRGPALTGLVGEVVEAGATGWNQRRCAVEEMYYNYELVLGRHREVIGDLSALVADSPLRERLVEQLMLALYRCGRQSEALSLYSGTRALLADQAGLDPGPDLQRLHRQILNADVALTAGRESDGEHSVAVMRAHPAVPRQLPGVVRHFAGRRAELTVLTSLLGEEEDTLPGGTVVISAIGGTAGIGKTALAVRWAHQVADRFPHGQLYVNLRGFDPSGAPVRPEDALRGFLRAFHVPPASIPADLDAQTGLYRSLLAGKRVLILLDNARDADQVRPLLPGSPGCFVIITSRDSLTGLVVTEGARPLTLDLLGGAEARDLLGRRLGPERIAAEPDATDQLVRLCARLPLALSVVAARVVSQPSCALSTLAEGLQSAKRKLDWLDTGDGASDVRAVFSWSYQNLCTAAARMFRLLGVCPGPDISLSAAASLTGMPLEQARMALHELTRANMIAEHATGRFTCHDLLRAYAAEKASAHDDKAACQAAVQRVLDHYLHTSHSGAMLLNPARAPLSLALPRDGVQLHHLTDDAQALAWFEAEHAVLIAAAADAAQRGFDTYAWQLPCTAADYFDRRGHWNDLGATQQTALTAARRTGDRAGQAYAHRALARAQSQLGCSTGAQVHLRDALSLYRGLGDSIGQARAHHDLGMLSEQQGDYADALDHAQQALDLVQAAGHRSAQARALNSVGWCHALLGNYRQALAHCQQALELHREFAYRHGEADTWDSLGYARQHLGDHVGAITCYARALDLHHQLGDHYYEAVVRTHQGDSHLAVGQFNEARDAWQRALTIFADLHHTDANEVYAKLSRLKT